MLIFSLSLVKWLQSHTRQSFYYKEIHREQDQLSHPFPASSPNLSFLKYFIFVYLKREHCNIPSMLYSRCSSRAQDNGSYFTKAHQQLHKGLTSVFGYFLNKTSQIQNKFELALSAYSWLKAESSLGGRDLPDPLVWCHIWNTLQRQSPCHAARSYLGHNYIKSTWKVHWRKSSGTGKKQSTRGLELRHSTGRLRVISRDGMGWWPHHWYPSMGKALQQHSLSLHHI